MIRWLLVFAMIMTSLAAAPPASLPAQTSRYNRGDAPGRYRDKDGHIRLFKLKRETSLYDGGAREIGKIRHPVMLNIGAARKMDVNQDGQKESYAWAWQTDAGSGWVDRAMLIDPPREDVDPSRNPKPPRESDMLLAINAAQGRNLLEGLRHVDSSGQLPHTAGNKGEHYAGRNPGPNDYVYLLFAVPDVQRGGVAKDSLPDGSRFVRALDEKGEPIVEVMTMYRDDDLNKPVPVTFIYGRAENGDQYGWIARANVGER